MAIYRRRLCEGKNEHGKKCPFEKNDATQLKNLPTCPKCGAATYYTDGWYAHFRIQGPQGLEQIKKNFPTQAKARAFQDEKLTDRRGGAVIDRSKDTTFTNAAKVFFDFLDGEGRKEKEGKGGLAPGTIGPYKRNTTNHLLPFFGKMKIDQITQDDVADFIEYMEDKPLVHPKTGEPMEGREHYAPATINRCLAALSRLMSLCLEKRLLRINQLGEIKLLTENNERDRYLADEEIDKLLEVCSAPRPNVFRKGLKGAQVIPHLRIATVLGLHTGLRIDGVLTLKWEEIDWKRNEIVKIVKHRRSKKPSPVRVPMSPVLREELLAWKKERGLPDIPPPKGYVIESPDKPGDHMLVGSDIGFVKACEDAGLGHFTFHQLRHTFCTHFLEQYPDQIEVLCDIVGHSSAYMTRRYAHITKRAKHRAMENFTIGTKPVLEEKTREQR